MEQTVISGRKVPISRNNLFYDDDAFDFDLDMGMDYVEHDANQTVVLYAVDLEKSNLNDLYKESPDGGIVFKTPVELHCTYEIEEPELKAYDTKSNHASYIKHGKLTFYVYDRYLEDNDITIKVGDYVGVQVSETNMEYFVVTNDGRINSDNKHSMYGTKGFWKTIVCASVDKNEFQGF